MDEIKYILDLGFINFNWYFISLLNLSMPALNYSPMCAPNRWLRVFVFNNTGLYKGTVAIQDSWSHLGGAVQCILTTAHSRSAGTHWISQNTPSRPHPARESLHFHKTPEKREITGERVCEMEKRDGIN